MEVKKEPTPAPSGRLSRAVHIGAPTAQPKRRGGFLGLGKKKGAAPPPPPAAADDDEDNAGMASAKKDYIAEQLRLQQEELDRVEAMKRGGREARQAGAPRGGGEEEEGER